MELSVAKLFFQDKNQYTNIMYKPNLSCLTYITENVKVCSEETHQNPNKIGFGVHFFQQYLQCSKKKKKKELQFKPVRVSYDG